MIPDQSHWAVWRPRSTARQKNRHVISKGMKPTSARVHTPTLPPFLPNQCPHKPATGHDQVRRTERYFRTCRSESPLSWTSESDPRRCSKQASCCTSERDSQLHDQLELEAAMRGGGAAAFYAFRTHSRFCSGWRFLSFRSSSSKRATCVRPIANLHIKGFDLCTNGHTRGCSFGCPVVGSHCLCNTPTQTNAVRVRRTFDWAPWAMRLPCFIRHLPQQVRHQ